MMSTAYFYRLNDVYQSSTVYLTFPCNRTKRYEHSYGTMELAGEMFFSAITNADDETLNSFFEDAEAYLEKSIQELLRASIIPSYCASAYNALKKCFKQVEHSEIPKETTETIKHAYGHYPLVEDLALSHYMAPFSNDFEKRKFLCQCLLEAVRIAALFHDAGHPPYSHIMETILDGLYKKCRVPDNQFNPSRANNLVDCLHPYKGTKSDNIHCLLSEPHDAKSALHEQVGLKVLAFAFDDIFSRKFNGIPINRSNKKNIRPSAVYYIAIAEFCFAILRDQEPFFVALHRIIDGTVDADRMDYIVRDTLNSGVNWGTIPYKRIIDSCKLVKDKQNGEYKYRIAFQRKMTDDIDDLLITRYKIFSRINFHHRSYKTSLLLQRIVKKLAEDYLSKNEHQKALCPGIADLWKCLSSTMTSGNLYIIQWNDSTLMSHLYSTLAEMKKCENAEEQYGISEDDFTDILSMLDDFLLNHKNFYSVFKRQTDQTLIFKEVFARLSSEVTHIISAEQRKYGNSKTEIAKKEAEDSLKRLDPETLRATITTGDADALMRLIPTGASLEEIIKDVLRENKENGKIRAYIYDHNSKRTKTGLSGWENQDINATDYDDSYAIYLYDSESDKPEKYGETALANQILALQSQCLEHIAYIEPAGDGTDAEIISKIRQEVTDRLYLATLSSLREMFSCLEAPVGP